MRAGEPVSRHICAVPSCTEQPFIQHPLVLCRQHALMVSLNVTDVLHANALTGYAASGLDIEKVSVCLTPVWKETSHPAVVYFLVNGDRVKIGTSTNITARVITLALRKSNAALLLNGGTDLENTLHRHFASDRIGKTEWFVLSKRIQDYIARRQAAAAALLPPALPEERQVQVGKVVVPAPRQGTRPSAPDKVVQALKEFTGSTDHVYLHKDQIGSIAGLERSTLSNALSDLVKAGLIHRQMKDGRVVRGMYAPGPAAADETGE